MKWSPTSLDHVIVFLLLAVLLLTAARIVLQGWQTRTVRRLYHQQIAEVLTHEATDS